MQLFSQISYQFNKINHKSFRLQRYKQYLFRSVSGRNITVTSVNRLGKEVVLLLLPPLETQHAGFPTLRLSPLSKSFFSRTGLSFMIPQKTSFLMVTPTVENLLLRKSLLTFLFVSLFHQNTFSILSQVDLHPP